MKYRVLKRNGNYQLQVQVSYFFGWANIHKSYKSGGSAPHIYNKEEEAIEALRIHIEENEVRVVYTVDTDL